MESMDLLHFNNYFYQEIVTNKRLMIYWKRLSDPKFIPAQEVLDQFSV